MKGFEWLENESSFKEKSEKNNYYRYDFSESEGQSTIYIPKKHTHHLTAVPLYACHKEIYKKIHTQIEFRDKLKRQLQ